MVLFQLRLDACQSHTSTLTLSLVKPLKKELLLKIVAETDPSNVPVKKSTKEKPVMKTSHVQKIPKITMITPVPVILAGKAMIVMKTTAMEKEPLMNKEPAHVMEDLPEIIVKNVIPILSVKIVILIAQMPTEIPL
jgi:hypothetical protein